MNNKEHNDTPPSWVVYLVVTIGLLLVLGMIFVIAKIINALL